MIAVIIVIKTENQEQCPNCGVRRRAQNRLTRDRKRTRSGDGVSNAENSCRTLPPSSRKHTNIDHVAKGAAAQNEEAYQAERGRSALYDGEMSRLDKKQAARPARDPRQAMFVVGFSDQVEKDAVENTEGENNSPGALLRL